MFLLVLENTVISEVLIKQSRKHVPQHQQTQHAGKHTFTLQQEEEQHKQKQENQKTKVVQGQLSFVCILHANPKTMA